ncbi:MAG TPA: glycosyltransferase [Aggregatilineaceae bacterium]|nr:glycosyltransferase [Aggregatilineaceae bacterium]
MSAPRPIRVMRIIARLNVGGPALHVTLLAERLGPPEFESTLVCGRIGPGEGDMAYLATERGIAPIIVPELGRELSPLRDVVTLFKLWRLMRRLKPDVVHTHTAKAGFVGRWAAWLARAPVRVHTYHGHVLHGYFGPAKTRLFLALERLTARITDRLITISPALRDELAGVYRVAPAAKFAVVPLGLELAPYAEAPRRLGTLRAAHLIPPSAPLIGIVGRIVPIKNHALFLDMAGRVLQAQPDAYFLVAGDGEDRAAIEARADRLGLRKRVVFTGWMQDLVPVFSDLDLLVLSSDNEGTPTAIMQALAAGVPVVATAVGGVPDLLRGGAWGRLVPPGDADRLAQAVLAALRDSAPDPAIRAAALAEYDAGRLAESLAALYRALLAGKDRRA